MQFKIKLKLWLSAQRLELLRNKSHWQCVIVARYLNIHILTIVSTSLRQRLEERDGGLPKLKKRFEWSSPSYHDVFLEETTLKFK